MNALLPLLISWLQLYGYPVLWICVFIASAGAPLPISLVLLAMGAFAALGDFNIFLLLAVTSSASVCGDSCGYLLGRQVGSKLIDRLAQPPERAHRRLERCTLPFLFPDKSAPTRLNDHTVRQGRRLHIISPATLARSQEYFRRRGAWAVLLSRCVVPALGGCINILAGTERYPYRRFLIYDICGEIIGAALPLTLGYTFGESWEAVGTLMTTISLFVLALLLVIYLAILLIRTLLRMKASQPAKNNVQREQGSGILESAAEPMFEVRENITE